MCVYARIHRCGCIYARPRRAGGWCQQSPFITLRPNSLSKVPQPNAELAACSGESHLHLRRLEFQVGICKGSRNPTYGSHTWMAQAFTSEPPSPYLIKKLHLLHGGEEGEGEHATEVRGQFSSPRRVGAGVAANTFTC